MIRRIVLCALLLPGCTEELFEADAELVPDAAVDMGAGLDAAPEPDVAPDPDAAEVDAAGPDAALDGSIEPDAHQIADAGPAPDPDSLAYCDCMLLTCHDLYHQLWGEDEGEARSRCFMVAAALARSPAATEGDNIECRQHWCDAAFDEDDLELCDRAGGLEVCED